jgi:hypothetical protein
MVRAKALRRKGRKALEFLILENLAALRENLFRQVVDGTHDAITHERRSEIQEQPKFLVSQPEVGLELLAMNRSDVFDGFEFEYDEIVHHDIGTEAFVEFEAVIPEGNRLLADAGQAPLEKEVSKGGFIDGFKQSGAKILMELHGGIDDEFADFVFSHEVGFGCRMVRAKALRRKGRKRVLRAIKSGKFNRKPE